MQGESRDIMKPAYHHYTSISAEMFPPSQYEWFMVFWKYHAQVFSCFDYKDSSNKDAKKFDFNF